MEERRANCYRQPRGSFGDGEKYCKLIFDGFLCWPDTKAGELVVQSCSSFLSEYSASNFLNATKQCDENGNWSTNPESERISICNLQGYNNGTAVLNIPPINIDENLLIWLPIIKQIAHIGYWISLISLIISVVIFTNIKKLQCARNVLHVHLFISFIMRAIMFILKEFMFVDGVAMATDVVLEDGKVKYITEHYNWGCKALTSVKIYFIQVNYMFILMEGVYLHNLIFLNLISENSGIKIYCILGWGIPIIFILIWVTLRCLFDNVMCWTANKNKYIAFLSQKPIDISILINFILFLSITRILCTKINTMYLQQKTIKYRRLIRSTLTLVFIYGVPYIISVAMSQFCENTTIELVWIACDQSFTAFQGFFMSMIYCFLNNEVRSEVRHKCISFYERHTQKRRTRTISNTVGFDAFFDANGQNMRI